MSALRSIADKLPPGLRQKAVALRDGLLLDRESRADIKRHRRYMTPSDEAFTVRMNDRQLETQLTKDYHRIEKGLAMPSPRRPFGAKVRARLVAMLPEAERSTDPLVAVAAERAREALAALDAWNEGGDIDPLIAPPVVPLTVPTPEELDGFFTSRHSLRDFDPERPVGDELLAMAANWAARTPSVCNRQAGRVHVFNDKETIARLLKIQAGNAGFGQTVPTLIAFTVESSLFAGSGERNQRWIDGSLFAMTYTWALHGLGVHSCMLNWAKRNLHSDAARRVGGIPESEDIICLLAIGYPATPEVRVARSPRRGTEEILRLH